MSVTHFVGDDVAVIVHGTATIIGEDHPDAAELDAAATGIYGSSPFSWATDIVFIRIEPAAM